jgi:uncharacterized membrane protein
VPVQLVLDQINAYSSLPAEQPPKTANRDSYRLIDWLTAIGLLVAGVAIAFALHPALFQAPYLVQGTPSLQSPLSGRQRFH